MGSYIFVSIQNETKFWVAQESQDRTDFPGSASGEELVSANAGDTGDTGSILGLERSLGGGNGNPLQYSCLENLMDKGAWQAAVHRVAKSWTQLK